jgi:D-glycero-D-manno-heptose 1,7-bisphosphate phosphatase
MKKLIILDRDGVINYDSKHYIKSPSEWHPIPGSLQAIALLKKANYLIAVATNQSGIARGYYDLATLDAIHEKMLSACRHAGGDIDGIYFCPHHPDEHCLCRKPQPGLLLQIEKDFQIPLKDLPMIGDRMTDVIAAQSVQAKPILLTTSIVALTTEEKHLVKTIPRFSDLLQATKALINHTWDQDSLLNQPHLADTLRKREVSE